MSVDEAFVRAIYTIKALSRGPNAIEKPSDEARIELYGLYKQATEGDIEGIMPRPDGDSPQAEVNRRKWDAWKSREGLGRTQAKLDYVELLLDTMRIVSPAAAASNPQFAELHRLWEKARSQPRPPSPAEISNYGVPKLHRAPSLSSHYSAYSQFLRRPGATGTSVGLPAVAAQSEYLGQTPGSIQSDPQEFEDPSNWRMDIAWQLESMNEEIEAMRRRYPRPLQDSRPKPKPDSSPSASDPKRTRWFAILLKWLDSTYIGSLRLVERLLGDAILVAGILVLLRFFASRPHLLRRMPIARRVVEVIGRIIALLLRELGFDVRPRMSIS